MRRKINYAGPSITLQDAEAVKDAVLHGFYENYRFHAKQLEDKLAEILNVKYVLATNSGTAALHLAVAALGIKEGDEVITSDSSCVASAIAIAYVGATAVCVDVDPDTWCLSPVSIRAAITPRTRAILAVHWNGHPAAMDEIMAIAREHKLLVIEDAAPALGAEFRGVKVGTIGDVGCYSFQGAKVAIGGQGGALVTNNVAVYEIAKCLASYGRTDSRMPYWSDYVGWNYTMPNLPAALAHSQILRLDGLIEFKRTLFGWYRDGLAGVAGVQVIEEAEGTKSTCCYPPLLVHESVRRSREEILSALRDDNIDARTAQPRISRMPMFTQRFPNSESAKVETHGIILPSAFNLTQGEIEFVCRRIRELVA